MARVSFLLTEPSADKPTPIFAFVSFDGKRVKVYTGLSIHPRYWIKDDQRARTRGYTEGGSINAALELGEQRLKDCYNQCRSRGLLPSAEQLRAAVEPVAAEEPASVEHPRVLADFAAYIERQARTKQAATVKSLRTTYKHVATFWESAYAGLGRARDLEYADLTGAFYDRFTTYLSEVVGLNDNSLSKQVSILKQFLSYALDHGRTDNEAYKRWSWARREPDVVALTQAELQAVEQLNLPNGHYLDNARGLFLISCYTGLRFSDVAALKPAHDKGDRLVLTTQKTRDTITTPVLPPARPLLDRLWAGELRVISNQKLNQFVKELAQRAGIAAPTHYTSFHAGKQHTQEYLKWELISSHTGRRTFVTISLEKGIAWEVIMSATGHKDWKSFRRYVKVTDTRKLEQFKRWGGTVEAQV